MKVEAGISGSASSGNALRLGNYSVVGGGGSSKQSMVIWILLAAAAVAALVIWKRK